MPDFNGFEVCEVVPLKHFDFVVVRFFSRDFDNATFETHGNIFGMLRAAFLAA
jgi:hypothetical protein